MTQFRLSSVAHLLLVCGLVPAPAFSATIIDVQTNVGSFKVELFEDQAPNSVALFLANLEAGNYHFSMVHEAGNLFVTGGRYFYNSCSEGASPVPSAGNAAVENTGLNNNLGTFALARDPSNPGQVTGQWVINLGNNETLYAPEVRPVVIGEIIEGLPAADSIADLWRVSMDVSPAVPTVNYDGFFSVICGAFTRDNVVLASMVVESIDQGPIGGDNAPNVFDTSSNTLNVQVDAGSAGLLGFALTVQSLEPEVVLQAQSESVVVLSEAVEGIATFNFETAELTLPELVADGAVAFTDVVFRLTDEANLLFTLVSASVP